MIIVKIIVFLVSLALVVVMDWSAEKDKQENEKRYKFWKDYWPVRNDNVIVLLLKSFLTGLAGFYATAETISYFFPMIENLPVADGGIELLAIIIFTIGSGMIFKKFGK